MTALALRDERAVTDWENEGGSVGTAPRQLAEPARRVIALGRPPLPPGYTSQPAWGFREQRGQLACEFNRVYGPPAQRDRRGPVCQLDEDRSYWCVTAPTGIDPRAEDLQGSWVTYAQAKRMAGTRLTFDKFCSPHKMRAQLRALLLADLIE